MRSIEESSCRDEKTRPMILLGGGQVLLVLAITYLSIFVAVFLAVHNAVTSNNIQIRTIHLNATGFHPSIVEALARRPIELRVSRDDSDACTSGIVIDEMGVRRGLLAGGVTTIILPPSAPGDYSFHCRMGRLTGNILVKE